MSVTLPYPDMDFTPLDILTAAEMDKMVANDQYLANFCAGLADGTSIGNGAIQARNVNFANFAVPVMIVNAIHPTGLTTNNNIFKMTTVDKLYEATGYDVTVTSDGHVKITLPATGTYVLKATFQSWINANSFDFLRFQIRKYSGSVTTTFADGMAYKGGAWGHFNLTGATTIKNDDLVYIYLDSNGNNYSDGNIAPQNTHLMIDVYRVA